MWIVCWVELGIGGSGTTVCCQGVKMLSQWKCCVLNFPSVLSVAVLYCIILYDLYVLIYAGRDICEFSHLSISVSPKVHCFFKAFFSLLCPPTFFICISTLSLPYIFFMSSLILLHGLKIWLKMSEICCVTFL